MKKTIATIFFLAVLSFAPVASAKTTDADLINQQIISLLQQIVILLTKQVEELTKQLQIQQKAIANLEATTSKQFVTREEVIEITKSIISPPPYEDPNYVPSQPPPPPPYFVAEITSDKDSIKNDGIDYVTFTIVTKLSNGKIISNKQVYVTIYGRDGIISFEEQTSNEKGIISYRISSSYCNPLISVRVNADGLVYIKSIGIDYVFKGGGACA